MTTPAGLTTHLTNPAGGSEPQPIPEVRTAAARLLKAYTTMTPQVLKALPESDAPPLGAAEIAAIIKVGSRSTVRTILGNAVRVGIAVSQTVPAKMGGSRKVYRRAPSILADDFLDSQDVYGPDEFLPEQADD